MSSEVDYSYLIDDDYVPVIDKFTLRTITRLGEDTSRGCVTDNLWVGRSAFSYASKGNEVTPYTTGKAYFSDLMREIRNAEESIYIAGWQINWDAQLDEKGARLIDVLLHALQNKARPNLKIYILPWEDTAPVQTYDDQAKSVFEALLNNERVFVKLTNSLADADVLFFSHHQKQIVIDERIGFVGGMDLAYGRFDDASYDLHANADGRAALNRYNSCVPPIGQLEKNEIANPDLLIDTKTSAAEKQKIIDAIKQMKTHQVPYVEDSLGHWNKPLGEEYTTLDANTQPRMPWQDVHLKIKGPAVNDLALNFVLRWNTEGKGGQPKLKVPVSSTNLPVGSGKCMVQVLRSASKNMCEAEYPLLAKEDQARFKKPLGVQDNHAAAMKKLIAKAQHFIYIENQFFVSGFGTPSIRIDSDVYVGPAAEVNKKAKSDATASRAMFGDTSAMPRNEICELLAKRINEVIIHENDHPFHVYITLPVHPEGPLNSGPIMSQVHWTMQTLVFGSHSLLNSIRRSLLAKELLKKVKDRNTDDSWKKAYSCSLKELDEIDIEKCFDYVTLLNLRNWAKLGTEDKPHYVTEQIYIHSKMMIVDDRYAIVGSANINDRSLLGGRDSELGVLIADTETENVDVCGDGKARPTRTFARKLRMAVWNKIFGLDGNVCTVRSADELVNAVAKPGAKESWEAIRNVAKENTRLYEAAFDFIPRNKTPYKPIDEGVARGSASIWPTWNRTPNVNAKMAPMPFDKEFWSKPQFNTDKVAALNGVKGYITLLPIEWTKGENNNLRYHPMLVTENKVKQTILPQAETQLVSIDPPPSNTQGKA